MGEIGERCRRPGGKAAEIEGQSVTQQLDPVELRRPQRLGMSGIVKRRIMAYAERGQPFGAGPDRKAIGPLAEGKQQVQLGIPSALRL